MTAPKPRVALVVGSGVAREIVAPVLDLLAAAGAGVEWERHDVADTHDAPYGEEVLEPALAAVRRVGVGLKTRLVGEVRGRFRSPNVLFRRRLDLWGTVRPVRALPGVPTRHPGTDVLIVRENTEDLYAGIEHEVVPGLVQSIKVVTEKACERIARFAFAVARRHGRKQVTFVHKANIMKRADGLFLRVARAVAAEHPDVAYTDLIVDAACMHLVLDPTRFDVVLAGNLYGDLLSDLVAGLAGGISCVAGIDVGDTCRVYEAVHGDAPDLVGTGRANPLPLLVPATHLLRHLGLTEAAERLVSATGAVLSGGGPRTPDLGGDATAAQMCEAIARSLGLGRA